MAKQDNLQLTVNKVISTSLQRVRVGVCILLHAGCRENTEMFSQFITIVIMRDTDSGDNGGDWAINA